MASIGVIHVPILFLAQVKSQEEDINQLQTDLDNTSSRVRSAAHMVRNLIDKTNFN